MVRGVSKKWMGGCRSVRRTSNVETDCVPGSSRDPLRRWGGPGAVAPLWLSRPLFAPTLIFRLALLHIFARACYNTIESSHIESPNGELESVRGYCRDGAKDAN